MYELYPDNGYYLVLILYENIIKLTTYSFGEKDCTVYFNRTFPVFDLFSLVV